MPYLPKAVRFLADPKLRNPDYVLSRLRSDPVWSQLLADTDLDHRLGRPRVEGSGRRCWPSS